MKRMVKLFALLMAGVLTLSGPAVVLQKMQKAQISK